MCSLNVRIQGFSAADEHPVNSISLTADKRCIQVFTFEQQCKQLQPQNVLCYNRYTYIYILQVITVTVMTSTCMYCCREKRNRWTTHSWTRRDDEHLWLSIAINVTFQDSLRKRRRWWSWQQRETVQWTLHTWYCWWSSHWPDKTDFHQHDGGLTHRGRMVETRRRWFQEEHLVFLWHC